MNSVQDSAGFLRRQPYGQRDACRYQPILDCGDGRLILGKSKREIRIRLYSRIPDHPKSTALLKRILPWDRGPHFRVSIYVLVAIPMASRMNRARCRASPPVRSPALICRRR